jgi:phosphatidylserine decarboxylase
VTLITFATAQLLRALPRESISHTVGRLCELPLPPIASELMSRAYSRAFQVNMQEAAAPHGSYRNFDAFFTRSLESGRRPIADQLLVSPCDGRLTAQGPIDEGGRLFLKGQAYEVAELLGQVSEAKRMVGGHYAVIYLSPSDYHRVHSPVDGQLCHVRAIPGDFYPVNAIGERCIPRLFVRNRRVVLRFLTPSGAWVVMVMVGAIIVGKISVNLLGTGDVSKGEHSLSPAVPVHRGDEVGAFHLGSTVVLLAESGVGLRGQEGRMLVGQSLSSQSP